MFSFKVKQLWVNNNIFSKYMVIKFLSFFSYVQEKYFVLVRIRIKKRFFFCIFQFDGFSIQEVRNLKKINMLL